MLTSFSHVSITYPSRAVITFRGGSLGVNGLTGGFAGNLRTQEPLPRLRLCGGFLM